MAKYKIFVSSVQKELKEERNAIKEIIAENYLLSEYFTVFRFEDLPAKSKSAEAVFLEEVKDSDIYIGILGNEYARTGKDGLSPTEKEYLEAKKSDKEILFFIKGDDSARDKRLKGLIVRIKDNAKGHCYEKFNTIEELKNELFRSLVDYLKNKGIVSSNDFDESICKNVSFNDIDEQKVRWFLTTAKNKRKYPLDIETPIKDALVHLNLLNNDKLTNAAVLLFSKTPNRYIRQAEIKCIQFPGIQVEKPFTSYQIYNTNLFEQIDRAIAFVLDSIKFSVIQQEHTAQVKRQHEIPTFVIQEAIVNAVIHRDYNNTGAVQVMVFTDRIEIWNPGGLTNRLTIEKLKKPHTSYPTNPLLAQIVYLADYIQRAGSGTIEMIKKCKEEKLPEPEFISTRHEFTTIIARDIYTENYLNKLGLNERQLQAVRLVKEKGLIGLVDFKTVYPSVTERTLNRDLQILVDKGVLKPKGEKRGRKYAF
jgi:predicted HTH transcriptional regulator